MPATPAPTPSATATTPPTPTRLASVDAYRGAVMFLMMAEVLELADVARLFKDSPTWQSLGFHQSHVEWRGCSVHDMIQPSFSFLVGAALPFSLASRARRGESLGKSTIHAAWRAFVLVALGIFLRSIGRPMTRFTFEDTLTQIGLGYLPLFLIGLARPWVRWAALALILVGYWGAFVAYPAPPADFDYKAVGVDADWPHHATGLAAHWNKNSNAAWAFDRWFLNRFPGEKRFESNGGGYATLSFIPTLGTMILGLIAGGWLIGERKGRGSTGGQGGDPPVGIGPAANLGRFALAGVLGVGLGYALDRFGICPMVKRIWTPSWVLFSGGICFGVLGLLHALLDLSGYAGWTYPLRVIGRNSIAAYLIAHLFDDLVRGSFRTHLGFLDARWRNYVEAGWGTQLGPEGVDRWVEAGEILATGSAVLLAYWLILFWMDRRKIYFRV